MTELIPRSAYMDGDATHRQYYGQFVTETVRTLVYRVCELRRLVDSKDPHFNDIPLKRWDACVRSLPRSVVDQLKLAGDCLTLCTGLCILKEAAQQLVERAVEVP